MKKFLIAAQESICICSVNRKYTNNAFELENMPSALGKRTQWQNRKREQLSSDLVSSLCVCDSRQKEADSINIVNIFSVHIAHCFSIHKQKHLASFSFPHFPSPL